MVSLRRVQEGENVGISLRCVILCFGGQAGYSLPELLHLARSAVASQRVFALNVLSEVLSRAKTAHYPKGTAHQLSKTRLVVKRSTEGGLALAVHR